MCVYRAARITLAGAFGSNSRRSQTPGAGCQPHTQADQLTLESHNDLYASCDKFELPRAGGQEVATKTHKQACVASLLKRTPYGI
jgi:hypothetical protein